MFRVSVKKKVLKDAEKMPVSFQESLAALLEDLREKGPVQPGGLAELQQDRQRNVPLPFSPEVGGMLVL